MKYLENNKILIKNIIDCFCQKDYESLRNFFHDDVTFFDIAHNHLFCGIEEVIGVFINNTNKVTFDIKVIEQKIVPVSSGKYLVRMSILLIQNKKSTKLLITAITEELDHKLRVCHLHILSPYPLKNLTFEIDQTKKLEERLAQENKKMQCLINSIPGGVFQCCYDDNLTLLEMSDGFIELVGFSREEIKSRFNNQLKQMIHPDDFESTRVEVKKQLKNSISKLIEYRIKCKNGENKWVLDKGSLIELDGRKVFSCIVIDISDAKKAHEELELSLERHQIIMNQTNNILFEWNIKENWIQFSNNISKTFNIDGNIKIFFSGDITGKKIYPKDYKKVELVLKDILDGVEFTECEIRIKDVTNDYCWYRFRTTTIFDSYQRPFRVVGIIINIDNEVKQSKLLLKQAQEDSLTGLKNRITVQQEIQNYLINHEFGALFLIDIDNFKVINDMKGHLVGDAVLINIANKMKQIFSDDYVIGRIGGDEFLVFVNSNDIDQLSNQANLLLESFNRMSILDGVKISCSIGIALVPQNGKTFNEIYQKADHALYYVKNKGKNQYAYYNDQEMNDLKVDQNYLKSIKPVKHSKITEINQDLIEYTFKLLYNSIDIESSLDKILEIIGTAFDVSRAYIFENTPDNKFCNNTYEWCNEGIKAQKDTLQMVSYESDIPGYLNNFNEDGIFYCQDISRLSKEHFEILNQQGIKSVLQCAITEEGQIKGFLGFDECKSNRLWQQENIDNLVYISEIISTFLLKKKAQERAHIETQNLKAVLDSQKQFTYIIDKNNYQLLWMNNLAQGKVPEAKLGETCYKAFMGFDEVCLNCPRKKINQNSSYHSVDIYNHNIDLWVKSNASLITWYGKEEILITCYDITEYKKK